MSQQAKWSVVEFDSSTISYEAFAWLEEESTDLYIVKKEWRTEKRTITDDSELTYSELSEKNYCFFNKIHWFPPTSTKIIDAVLFAAKSDAIYFKMRFL